MRLILLYFLPEVVNRPLTLRRRLLKCNKLCILCWINF